MQFLRKLLLVMLLILTSYELDFFPIAYAKEIAQVSDIQVKDWTGELLKIEDSRITLKQLDETKVFEVPSSVKVTRNGLATEFRSLKLGDVVTVSTTPNGEIIALSSVSGQAADTAKLAVPLVILTFIAGVILYVLFKKANKPKIKTQV